MHEGYTVIILAVCVCVCVSVCVSVTMLTATYLIRLSVLLSTYALCGFRLKRFVQKWILVTIANQLSLVTVDYRVDVAVMSNLNK